MKNAKIFDLTTVLTLVLLFSLSTGSLLAQEDASEGDSSLVENPSDASSEDVDLETLEENLHFSDYMVKGYSLTGFYGTFSGATYLENQELDDRTVLTDGAGDIIAFSGGILAESRDIEHYDAAIKEIQQGPAFGGRVGLFVNRDFHMDIVGTYATGKAVTTMRYMADPDDPSTAVRVQVDEDPDFSLIKGGIHLSYDARPAAVFGITPKLGFGLGGMINRFSHLEDKTALYLEGNFGLQANIMKNLSLLGQVDLTTFAFDVDELGYSNIVKYTTFTLGLTWFIDVIPANVRAEHLAELQAAEDNY